MQTARGASLTEGAADTSGAAVAAPPRARRTLLLGSVAVAIVAADLISKLAIVASIQRGESTELLGGLVHLVQTRNPGAAWSVGTNWTIALTCFAMLVVVVISRMAFRVFSPGWAVALGLVLGGAGGNLIDRLFRSPGVFRGAVVDFVALWDPINPPFPVFNVADSALCIGVGLAVLLEVRGRRIDGRRRNDVAQ